MGMGGGFCLCVPHCPTAPVSLALYKHFARKAGSQLHRSRPCPILAVLDLDGKPLASKTVSVNQPLRFGGVTAYQTDWSMSGLQLQVEGSEGLPQGVTFQLPMASLQGERAGGRAGRAAAAGAAAERGGERGGGWITWAPV